MKLLHVAIMLASALGVGHVGAASAAELRAGDRIVFTSGGDRSVKTVNACGRAICMEAWGKQRKLFRHNGAPCFRHLRLGRDATSCMLANGNVRMVARKANGSVVEDFVAFRWRLQK